MAEQHEVSPGESLLNIAADHGLLPVSIWNDPNNSALRRERRHWDHLIPGDILSIRDIEARIESGATEQRHRYVRKGGLGVVIRLDVDPAQAAGREDRFILTSSDSSYRTERTVKDDLVPGDEYVDLFFSGLSPHKSYTLEIFSPGVSDPTVVFENVPYADLANLSSSASGGEEQPPPQGTEEEGWEEDEDQAEEAESGDASTGAEPDSESGEAPEEDLVE